MLRELIGLSFNDEIYFHMSKGLLPQDLLEMLSNQTELSSNTCIVAPCMFLKQIWDYDPDYKAYYEQIFANLHDTFVHIQQSSANSESNQDGNQSQKPDGSGDIQYNKQVVTTNIPEDLKRYYDAN